MTDEIITIGDEITHLCHLEEGQHRLIVTHIERGRYGLYCEGEHLQRTYLPYELPPVEQCDYDWYGWYHRCTDILPNGMRLGSLCGDRDWKLTDYEREWERTVAELRKETA